MPLDLLSIGGAVWQTQNSNCEKINSIYKMPFHSAHVYSHMSCCTLKFEAARKNKFYEGNQMKWQLEMPCFVKQNMEN